MPVRCKTRQADSGARDGKRRFAWGPVAAIRVPIGTPLRCGGASVQGGTTPAPRAAAPVGASVLYAVGGGYPAALGSAPPNVRTFG